MQMGISLVEDFLKSVEALFPTPLSQRQNLSNYAQKLVDKATLCVSVDKERIVSMVAGYTDNLEKNMAYIALVATLPEFKGKGLATSLIRQFIDICISKSVTAIHLYTDRSNFAAINMYKKLGFEEWLLKDEPRPNDLHFIYYLKNEDNK